MTLWGIIGSVSRRDRGIAMIKRMKKAASALLVPAVLLTGCAVNFGKQVYDNEEMIGADYDRYNEDYFSQSAEGDTLSGSA